MRTNTLPVNLSAAENEVVKAFFRWSEKSGISITSTRPQWRQNADDYMLLECRADTFGSIEAVSRFLYESKRTHWLCGWNPWKSPRGTIMVSS